MARLIPRPAQVARVVRFLSEHRVVALLGARQVGKSTLARMVADKRGGAVHWFDLENPRDLASLEEPLLALERLSGLVVLDEIQRRSDLFPLLRVLVDRPRAPRYLVLGSAAPDLLRQASESLAGRVVYHQVGGLSLDEVSPVRADTLWLRGGLPRSFTARSTRASFEWREAFVRTFLERDIPQLGLSLPAATLERFWAMLAHWHGQSWNGSDLGRSLGVSDHTVRRWLDVLAATFMVRVLPPFFENLSKRQVKAPKVYVADSGLLHALLGIRSLAELARHPKVGASWEGFALEAVIAHLDATPREVFHWRTQAGAELDLLVTRGRRRRGFEFKRTDAPALTPSMRVALQDLRLDSLDVIYPGAKTYPLASRVRAVPLARLLDEIRPLE
jgi:predicted AAA+ superfamily ATPase